MNAKATPASSPISKTLGHLALHYRKTEDGPRAARLFEKLGYVRVQEIPLPNGSNFYQFAVDGNAPLEGDGILYLSRASEQQLAVLDAVHSALRIGQSNEHPAVSAMRAAQVTDPEVTFHVGILMKSLEELESLVVNLRESAQHDPDFKGHIKVIANRARRGDAKIDARMDASPVFGHTPRECYGKYGCQAFIETDLLTSGPLGDNLVIELDYVFPGHPQHMFNKTEI
jgi:hypothetical protein